MPNQLLLLLPLPPLLKRHSSEVQAFHSPHISRLMKAAMPFPTSSLTATQLQIASAYFHPLLDSTGILPPLLHGRAVAFSMYELESSGLGNSVQTDLATESSFCHGCIGEAVHAERNEVPFSSPGPVAGLWC